MLTTITIIIILLILFSFNCTIRTMLRVQENQHNINKELKERIENRDDFMCKVDKLLREHMEEEDKIFKLISNFGKEE